MFTELPSRLRELRKDFHCPNRMEGWQARTPGDWAELIQRQSHDGWLQERGYVLRPMAGWRVLPLKSQSFARYKLLPPRLIVEQE